MANITGMSCLWRRCCQRSVGCQATSSSSSRTAPQNIEQGTPLRCCDVKHQASLDRNSGKLWGPANSPDLNPVDYRIWGLIQEHVYQTAIWDIDELKERVIVVWAELKQSVIDKAIEQWRPSEGTSLRTSY